MSFTNEYNGYAVVPNEDNRRGTIRLDFNAKIESSASEDGVSLKYFHLRMFDAESIGGRERGNEKDAVEIGVSMTPEQWLDLIDQMKDGFDTYQDARTKAEDL